MRRAISLFVVLSLWLLGGAAYSQYNSFPPGIFTGRAALDPAAGGGACVNGTNAGNFIARTSGLNATYLAAYCNLINASDTHGYFTKLNFWYVFGTQDNVTAFLNIVGTANSPAVPHPNLAGVSWTTDGVLGVDASSTVYVDSTFDPFNDSTNFVRDSAHLSAWSFTNAASGASGGQVIGYSTSGFVGRIFPKYNDGNTYSDVNSTSNSAGVANADSTGWYTVNRSGASAVQHYRNAVSLGATTEASVVLPNENIVVLASNTGGVFSFGGGYRIGMASAGSSLTSQNVTDFYNDMCAFFTSVRGSC